MNTKPHTPQNIRLAVIIAGITALLMVPLIAMQFTTEVNWTWFDFVVAGILLYGTGLLCELVLRKVRDTGRRFLIIGIVMVVLFLVWAELAVGVFGTPLAGS
ncbi:MAG TPA: hypothetical protein VGD89_13845 [Flavipsychrobacter sp.]